MENNNLENNNVNEQSLQNKKAGKKIGIFLGALSLAGIAYGANWFFYASNFEDTDNAYVNANQISVASSVGGTVVELHVSDTMRAQKNELAVKVEDTDYQFALDRARTELVKMVKEYNTLKYNVDQSKTIIKMKQISLRKAQDDLARERSAFGSGVATKESLDNARFKFDEANNELDNAQITLRNANNLLFTNDVMKHPDVIRAIISFKQAYIDLSRTHVYIPEEGVVAKKAVNIGQKIVPNQNLFTVIDEKNEWVDANLKESQLKGISVGQKVELLSDVNKKTYIGYVQQIGAGSGSSLSLLPAQNATGNWIKVVQRVPVRIAFEEQSIKENGYLPIGTSMRISIDKQTKKDISYNVALESKPDYSLGNADKEIKTIIDENLDK